MMSVADEPAAWAPPEPVGDDPVIDVRGLTMRYGTLDVLCGVEFSAQRGEVLTLLGPNGAGKTTTVEILEGFRIRSAGEVSVLGVDPAVGGEDWRARLGIVLQSWRDHGKWKVRELLHHAVLSGGQRRRLDVAIGLVGRPDVMFLDEPTAGFDPEARRDFHDLVHQLADLEDTTVLLTTHDLAEAERLADRILILAGGQIVADGSADQLTRQVAATAEVRWSRDGQHYVHATDDATAFVRHLLSDHGDAVSALEVKRPSLEDTYMTLVHQHETGHHDGGVVTSLERALR